MISRDAERLAGSVRELAGLGVTAADRAALANELADRAEEAIRDVAFEALVRNRRAVVGGPVAGGCATGPPHGTGSRG
ncbi:hypothetical protein ABT337_31915 [Saccharopolyspora hirsuta]|uniref:hypothetical protein n=1 Tax=Saccharopolyspora hirsuta TaxID=1837 RepID=UPI0014796FEF|nr:hypothetical protein [Saccharopolyspora hirsuta]